MKQAYITKSLLYAGIFLVLGAGMPAYAKKAELVLFPTRLVLEDRTRTATVTLKNSGDGTGEFTVDALDMIMPEDGPVREVKEGETVEFSALPMLRISPRSMTLGPGETQNIRILIRTPETLEDGEYRAHLRVKMVNDNADPDPSEKGPTVQVKANLALIIPIILREGKTDFQATLSEAKLIQNGAAQSVQLYLGREGNQSSMGDFKVLQGTGAEEVVLGELKGVPVYRPTVKRLVNIPLEKAPTARPIKILYLKQEKDETITPATLAEATIR